MGDEYKVAVDARHAVELDDGRTIAPGGTVEIEDIGPEAKSMIDEGILVRQPPEEPSGAGGLQEPEDDDKKATPKKATPKKKEDS